MKSKNIKRYYKNKIRYGWRPWIALNVDYKTLGLNKSDFVTEQEIADKLGLTVSDYEAISVAEHLLVDNNDIKFGVPRLHNIRFVWSFLDDNGQIPEFALNNEVNIDTDEILISDDKYYYIEDLSGYRNPNYNYDVDSDEPYWFTDENGNNYVTRNNLQKGENVKELIEAYKNLNELEESLFSGEIIFRMLSNGDPGKYGTVVEDFSELCGFCKSVYIEPEKDKLQINFSIRYTDYIEDFLRVLKKIVIKYKLKKMS